MGNIGSREKLKDVTSIQCTLHLAPVDAIGKGYYSRFLMRMDGILGIMVMV